MVVVRSVSTATSMPAGRSDEQLGQQFRTLSTVAMTLAPGWRWMLSRMAGVRSAQAARRVFSGPSTTVAMSLTRTGAPLR